MKRKLNKSGAVALYIITNYEAEYQAGVILCVFHHTKSGTSTDSFRLFAFSPDKSLTQQKEANSMSKRDGQPARV
jgi:hypothetical protein